MNTVRVLLILTALSAVAVGACSNEETGVSPNDATTVAPTSPLAATAPTAPPIAAQTAQISDGTLKLGARVTTLNPTGESIRLRVTPSMTSVTFATVPNGSSAVITSGPASAEGRTWYEIETSEGKGWTQSDFLRPSSTLASESQQSSTTAGTAEDDSPNSPRGVVANFYLRLERFDTAGMLQLVCPEIRDETESGLSMLQSMLGLGSVLGVGATNWDIVDFDAEVISEQGDYAKVQVVGRLLAGCGVPKLHPYLKAVDSAGYMGQP